MSFQSPLWLLALLLIPALAVAYAYGQRRPSSYAVEYSNLSVLAVVADRRSDWLRHVPAALLLVALAALGIAMARPLMTFDRSEERATVVLVVDVSGSMRAEDVKPTRLGAAQQAVDRFLSKVPDKLRVGVVAFSDNAEVVTVPTTDRGAIGKGLELLTPGQGTAIGDALARSVELALDTLGEDGSRPTTVMENGEPLAAIVMLSDGFQTRGILTPQEGTALARRAAIPVSTVALGTDSGTILVERFGSLQRIPVPPDRVTLSQIAQATGGTYHDAPDAETAFDVYERLGSRIGREAEPREVTVAFVGAGMALLLAAAGIALVRLPPLG